jgi:hypothetical protein
MRPTVYPLFFVLAPILALAGENVDQGTLPSDLLVPLAIAGVIWIVGLLVARLTTRDRHRQALVATVVVIWFSAYGPVHGVLLGVADASVTRADSILIGLTLSAVLAIGLISRSRRPLDGATAFLFALGGIFCLISGGRLAWEWGNSTTFDPLPAAGVTAASERGESGPDIWLLVLDAYTGAGTLRSEYGLDNTLFLEALEARGFQVPRKSRANYVTTLLSLGAMLNWDYMHQGYGSPKDYRATHERLEYNRTVRELKRRDYEFIFFRSSYPPLSGNTLADVQIPPKLTGEFTRYWLSTTSLFPVALVACRIRSCEEKVAPFLPESPRETDEKVQALMNLASRPGPKFVFAHFLLPHGPFRLDSTCQPREPVWPRFQDPGERELVRRLYADQVRCANRKVVELVDGILERSPSPPVILVQGDHGYGMFARDHPLPLEDARPEQVRDRIEVLAAYHAPGAQEDLFWDEITPVNVLRTLFSEYFGFDLERLPDRTYWSEWDHPYRVTPVPPALYEEDEADGDAGSTSEP